MSSRQILEQYQLVRGTIAGVPQSELIVPNDPSCYSVYPVELFFKERNFRNEIMVRAYRTEFALPWTGDFVLRPGISFEARVVDWSACPEDWYRRKPRKFPAPFEVKPRTVFSVSDFEVTKRGSFSRPPGPNPAPLPLLTRLKLRFERPNPAREWLGYAD